TQDHARDRTRSHPAARHEGPLHVNTDLSCVCCDHKIARRYSAKHGRGGMGEHIVGAKSVSSHTLLVVDDNDANRDLLSRRLTRRGYGVETAATGPDALEMVRRKGIDLVLLDLMMPGMSGIEVLRELRKEHSEAKLPDIMVT